MQKNVWNLNTPSCFGFDFVFPRELLQSPFSPIHGVSIPLIFTLYLWIMMCMIWWWNDVMMHDVWCKIMMVKRERKHVCVVCFCIMTLHSLGNDFGVLVTFTMCFIWVLHPFRNDFEAFTPLLGVFIEQCLPLGTALELLHIY